MKTRPETSFVNNTAKNRHVKSNTVFATESEDELKKQNKILKSRLQQASKMENIGLMASGIAHDFNNILHLIIGYSEIAMQKSQDNSLINPYLSNIHKNAKIGQLLTQKISNYNQQLPNSGYKSLILQHEITDAVELIEIGISKKITLKKNITNTGIILAEATDIFQIVMNLCFNAIHAMKVKGGLLNINLNIKELDGKTWHRLEIKDTGHGMNEVTLNNIFDPFFTTKPAGEGTGLGLLTVSNIINQYQGEISVTSDFGSGSCFSVLLPINN